MRIPSNAEICQGASCISAAVPKACLPLGLSLISTPTVWCVAQYTYLSKHIHSDSLTWPQTGDSSKHSRVDTESESGMASWSTSRTCTNKRAKSHLHLSSNKASPETGSGLSPTRYEGAVGSIK